MIWMHDPLEKLRPLVGFKGWNYCVVWKLTENQSCIEWVSCCCAGAQEIPEEHQFPVTQQVPCRDSIFHHQATLSCEILSQLPTLISLESGSIYAQALEANAPFWLNLSPSNSDMSSCGGLEAYGTRVLIPIAGGLVELYVTKQVTEEQSVIEFVSSQCNSFTGSEFVNQVNTIACTAQPPDQASMDALSFSTFDRIRLNNSQMNFMHGSRDGVYYDAAHNINDMSCADTFGETEESIDAKEFEREINNVRAGSISDCSDQIDDDEENGKCGKKKGGKVQAKNLDAERKRRKKLSDRLLTLRSLVPKITKLDKASVLGDAISFVKDLQRQQKELQDEVDEPTDDEGYAEQSNLLQESSNGEYIGYSSGNRLHGASTNQSNNEHLEDAQQKGQMEPQVEVAQIGANKFFVKVFCEYKKGGFVRLMEALNSLGVVVTNANVTRVLSLVSNVFQIEKEETNESLQADYLRESLIELNRNPRWPDTVSTSNSCDIMDFNHQHHLMQDSPY